ncbi:hypothetical protein DFH07DRAFT_849928 [Mycena maculata]|uniref:Glycosyltransferase 61 catalytic domain-containing protein n=1 Tax=Mycena maculata TaxID=230809 RepID=A0AAD7HXA9_9AGAR|nr:hypothetical protein DFH07DRAFT_849928 [Mycena maculata]
MAPRLAFTRRDAILLLLGAAFTRLWFIFAGDDDRDRPIYIDAVHTDTITITITEATATTLTVSPAPTQADPFPATSLVAHAPGWTLFEDVYMSNGTLFIVSDNPSEFPEIRMMISTGLIALNEPENIAAREPTSHEMAIISTQEARSRWGANGISATAILPVEGNTFLVNEPAQFLRHYFHFVAELFFGAQVFWHGAFFRNRDPSSSVPPIHRLIFTHSNSHGWHDEPGLNTFFLQAAFPSIHVEVHEAWDDRIALTAKGSRVWRFPRLLLSDRSAAHRGQICGTQTQRIASEAWKYMQAKHQLMGIRGTEWWEPVRTAVLRLAKTPKVSSGDVGSQAALGGISAMDAPKKVVISYISRQTTSRRRLTDESHAGLVAALTQLVQSKGDSWELNVLETDKMTKEEQLQVAGRTDILLGVHGNGLTHLVMMPPTPISTVIEIFYPGGYAHDYEWTATALRKSHFAIWNDSVQTAQQLPTYPEGFHGSQIPVDGPTVARLIDHHLAGRL